MGRLRIHRTGAALTLAALILWCIQFAGATTPSAHATPGGLGQQVQGQVVTGSEIQVYVLDHLDQPKPVYQGSLAGPSGSLEWDLAEDHGMWTTVGIYNDVEAGEYTVISSAPITPGWEVYGYHIIPGSEGNVFSCGQDVSPYVDEPTFELTPTEDFWTVCVAVMPEGGIPGGKVAVQFTGEDQVGLWAGSFIFPGKSWPLADFLKFSSARTWHNPKPGKHTLSVPQEAKPGLYRYGYHLYESGEPHPACPSDPAEYGDLNFVEVSEAHPQWVICVLIVDDVDGVMTLKVDGPTGVEWAGTVKNTPSLNTTWAGWGVDAFSNVGTKDGLVPGYYSVASANPVASGWSFVGLASFESTAPNPTCPASVFEYWQSNGALITPSKPDWAVCVKVAPVESVPGTGLRIYSNNVQRYGYVDGPANYDFSFASIGLIEASGDGSKPNIPYGIYTIVANETAVPGMILGYHTVALPQFDMGYTCPTDPGEYTVSGNSLEVSAEHPIWLVCFGLLPAPVQADPPADDSSPADPPSDDPPAPDSPPNGNPGPAGDAPAQNAPGSSPEQPETGLTNPPATPSATPAPGSAAPQGGSPSSGNPDGTPAHPGAPASPGDTQAPAPEPASGNPGGVLGANATPIAPSTGESSLAPATNPMWRAAGLILVALAAASLAAGWLPSRRKR